MLMIGAAVFGIDTKASTTYQLFVLLLVIFAFSLLGSLVNTLKVTVDRKLPKYVTAGEPFTYQMHIKNLTGKTYYNLAFIDVLAESFPGLDEIKAVRGLSRPWLISFHRWRRFLAKQRGGTAGEIAIPCLAHQPIRCKISFVPLRRGVLVFSGCYIAKPDPLGLFRRLLFVEQAQHCLVLPKRHPMNVLPNHGEQKYQPGGFTQANSVGESTEFMSLREYRYGDPLHLIHWKSFAKQRRLISKEYQDEYFVRQALVLDTFSDEAATDQFEAAVSVAASIAYSEQHNDALLDLMFAGSEVFCFTTGRGIDQMQHLQEILAAVQPSRNGSFKQLQQTVEQYARRCSSLVCVLLHWDTERQQFINKLQSRGIPVIVFHVFDGSKPNTQTGNPSASFHLVDSLNVAESLAAI